MSVVEKDAWPGGQSNQSALLLLPQLFFPNLFGTIRSPSQLHTDARIVMYTNNDNIAMRLQKLVFYNDLFEIIIRGHWLSLVD